MIKARFLPAAELELLKEIAYYSRAREGSGLRFHAAIKSAVARAVAHPSGGAPSHKGTRSILVRGFPFSIVYRASDTELLIVAVAPHRRQPEYWSSRIE